MSISVMKSGVPLVEKIIALRKKFCKLKMNTKTFFLQCSLEEVIQNPGKKKNPTLVQIEGGGISLFL